VAEHFTNEGYGWTCRRCGEPTAASHAPRANERARFFHEGESEERDGPPLASRALARWRDDATRRILFCPLCGVEEDIEKA
jgi:hypothetical protein